MYKRASSFMNSGRFGAFVGTGLEVKAPPGRTPPPAKNAPLPERITIDERAQLGRGHPEEGAFLDAVQAAITGMVRAGIKKPKQQAERLNGMGLKPFNGYWTPRLVVMFFQRQDERRKAQANLEKSARDRGTQAAKEATRGAVRRTDRPPANPVLSSDLAAALLRKLQG